MKSQACMRQTRDSALTCHIKEVGDVGSTASMRGPQPCSWGYSRSHEPGDRGLFVVVSHKLKMVYGFYMILWFCAPMFHSFTSVSQCSLFTLVMVKSGHLDLVKAREKPVEPVETSISIDFHCPPVIKHGKK